MRSENNLGHTNGMGALMPLINQGGSPSDSTVHLRRDDQMDCPDIAPLPRKRTYVSNSDVKVTRNEALFCALTNTAYLGQHVGEDSVDIFLAHEIAHWVSYCSLTPEERYTFLEKQQENCMFFERIAYWTEYSHVLNTIIEEYGSLDEAERLANPPRLELTTIPR